MTQTRPLVATLRRLSLATAATLGVGLAAAQEITVVSFGGAYQEGQSKALFQPAAKALNMKLKEETYTGIADLRLKVKAGAVTWDIVASGSGSAARAAAEGILEKLDYKVIDISSFAPGMATDYCVGGDVFSTVLAWNTKTYGDKGPQSWADFWDVKKFPGKRAYRKGVAGALEPALMADGVPPNKVYEVLSQPGGIERALKKIRELKPHIAVWWSSGAQHAQLMKDGEVDMTTGWNGRFDVVAKDGGKVAYTFNQGLLDYDCFAVPKGRPTSDAAMKFLAEISKPPTRRSSPNTSPTGPPTRRPTSWASIDPAYARRLPSHPDNAAKQLIRSPRLVYQVRGRRRHGLPEHADRIRRHAAAGRHHHRPRPAQALWRVCALDDVDLDVRAGEFLTLLGPSGSGKTTLLMVLAGFIRPDQGSLRFGETRWFASRRTSATSAWCSRTTRCSRTWTWPPMSAYPLKLRGVPGAELQRRVEAALDTVQLGGYGGVASTSSQRRPAPARGAGPRHRVRAAHRADGRAAVGARQAAARAHADRAAAPARPAGHDHHLRHA
jgi:putative spermidine/putrescine transport system substrate-binding protein